MTNDIPSQVIWKNNSTENQLKMVKYVNESVNPEWFPGLIPSIAAISIFEMLPKEAIAIKHRLIQHLKKSITHNGASLKEFIDIVGISIVSLFYSVCFYLLKNGMLPKIKHAAKNSVQKLAGSLKSHLDSIADTIIFFPHPALICKVNALESDFKKSTIKKKSPQLHIIPDIQGM